MSTQLGAVLENSTTTSDVEKPRASSISDLSPDHPYCLARKLSKKDIQHFGLGLAAGNDGGRDQIMVPLHSEAGILLAYAALIPTLPFQEPGIANTEFRSILGNEVIPWDAICRMPLLYNSHRFNKLEKRLFIVRDIISVWHLHKCGFSNAVATIGGPCTEEQFRIIAYPLGPEYISILSQSSDADDAFADSILHKLSPFAHVRWKKLIAPVYELAEDQIKWGFRRI